MSNLYNLEPQPTAKVVLQTTAGDISLELFAKQTPLASRNFLQHCVDGYYNNTVFHRLVPDFIIQGGDPTGTGSGGISGINDGEPFKDEFHSRLKFNRRGLLGMANEGKDSNGSQFFLTLGKTPELQDKHTMFGRVEGETIYNLMKMAEAELVEGEGSERPLYPTRIMGTEVLVNPFEDMVVRVREAPRTKDVDAKKDAKKRKKPAGKNVLSFGGEEGEGELVAPVLKKAKVNPKMVSAGIEEPEKPNNVGVSQASKENKPKQRPKPKSTSPIEDSDVQKALPKKTAPPRRVTDRSPSTSPEPEQVKKTNSLLDRTNAEIAALKASMKRNVDTAPKQKEKPRSALEAMIPTNSTKGRKRGKASDEKGALDLFKSFKQRLHGLPESDRPSNEDSTPPTNGHNAAEPTATESAEDDEADLCDLHFIANCQSCRSWQDHTKPDPAAEAEGEENDSAWMIHTLSAAKDTLGKDLKWKKQMEEIEVIDPREKAKAIQEERKKGRSKGKEKVKM